MKNEIAIKVLEEKIESLSAEAKAKQEAQDKAWEARRDVKVEKQEVEIWFRWNDGTLGKNQTVKVASATYENETVIGALNSIYGATQNDFGSWVDKAEENGLTLHVNARNEKGISQGSSYVGDIIIINGDMYEVADWGFNKLDENDHADAIEAFKNEVVFGRANDEERIDSSRDAEARREGWKSAREYYDSGVLSLWRSMNQLKESK